MKILAIETSTHACSVALNSDGNIIEKFRIAPREHNQILLPMIESLLKETSLSISQLDAIAFGCGPGSFTGIRIAAAVTQGLAMSHDIPVIPISTLLIMAQTAFLKYKVNQIIPCIDARMDEVYWNVCRIAIAGEDLMEIVGQEYCTKPDELKIPPEGSWIGVGDGWEQYATLQDLGRSSERLKNIDSELYPQASALAQLAGRSFKNKELKPPEGALPTYLRDLIFKKRAVLKSENRRG